ncbi:manganese efflux pump MntP family protein [Peribacillus muralis]|uniref:manganese efflux pump MntP n=1 Tax=Peribacillus muralis TaxID=264697 RepID=UPI00071029E0|nr:manganese efflux pump MntP family protein [Peribacillus muralis]
MNTIAGEIITLLLMAFALGMDAFSVGLGMGMFKLRLRQIFSIGLIVGMFHIWMPLLGMGAGRFISEKFGTFATYAGGLLLIILGIQMFIPGKKDESGLSSNKMLAPVGKGLLIFALGVSLDSFSVGLTLGIYGAKTVVTVLCFGVAATLLTWAGLLLGRKMQGLLGVYSEILGGSILCAFGIKLLFSF